MDRVQVKSAYEPSGASGPSLSWFLFSMKQLGVFLLPLGGVLVHGTHLYTWVGCESKPKNTTQCEQSGLGTWMGNLEMSTIRPPCKLTMERVQSHLTFLKKFDISPLLSIKVPMK